ncbi:hypothetical protein [uncultured Microbulbifer sp.]|uniref:hypothetical protein n=1 Tax=uncultured Microbulbifer sp. TaxID=348147 RepID=UPI00260EEC51|nr:hypothetical protein [uncultured Microbulbifer sp.]
MSEALKQSKGSGNFRNLFLYNPNGKKGGIQITPISEVAAKDEFLHIKDASRDAVLAAHRVPPQLMDIIHKNKADFGDVEKATRLFIENELKPLQVRFAELNEWIGETVVQFQPYQIDSDSEPHT